MLGKRGQVYILAAVILAVVFVSLTASPNTLQEKRVSSDFQAISENYANEGSRLVNSLLYNTASEDVLKNFGYFTVDFTSYSKNKNSNLGLFYVVTVGENTLIGNYLDKPIIIRGIGEGGSDVEIIGCFEIVPTKIIFEGLSLEPKNVELADIADCTIQIPKRDNLLISIGEIDYRLVILEDKPQLLVVTQEEREDERQVFVGGEIATLTQMECTSDMDCIKSQLCTVYDKCSCTSGNMCVPILCDDIGDCAQCVDSSGEPIGGSTFVCPEEYPACDIANKCKCLQIEEEYGICTDKGSLDELMILYSNSNPAGDNTGFIIPQCYNDADCLKRGYCNYGLCNCLENMNVCVVGGAKNNIDSNSKGDMAGK